MTPLPKTISKKRYDTPMVKVVSLSHPNPLLLQNSLPDRIDVIITN